MALAHHGGHLWNVGGDYQLARGTPTPTDEIERGCQVWFYTIANDSWRRGPALRHARRGASCVIQGTNLYVIGGIPGDAPIEMINLTQMT